MTQRHRHNQVEGRGDETDLEVAAGPTSWRLWYVLLSSVITADDADQARVLEKGVTKSLVIGGKITRIACGRMTRKNVRIGPMPTDAAASH